MGQVSRQAASAMPSRSILREARESKGPQTSSSMICRRIRVQESRVSKLEEASFARGDLVRVEDQTGERPQIEAMGGSGPESRVPWTLPGPERTPFKGHVDP